MSDNSWYENGKLPPVGIECEAFRNPIWVKCEIKAHMVESGQVCAFYQMDNKWGFDSSHQKFRPIKTEREIAVDLMVEEIYGYYGNPKGAESYIGIASFLYDAGYRKTHAPD